MRTVLNIPARLDATDLLPEVTAPCSWVNGLCNWLLPNEDLRAFMVPFTFHDLPEGIQPGALLLVREVELKWAKHALRNGERYLWNWTEAAPANGLDPNYFWSQLFQVDRNEAWTSGTLVAHSDPGEGQLTISWADFLARTESLFQVYSVINPGDDGMISAPLTYGLGYINYMVKDWAPVYESLVRTPLAPVVPEFIVG